MRIDKWQGRTAGRNWVKVNDSTIRWTVRGAGWKLQFWNRGLYREGVLIEPDVGTLAKAIPLSEGYELALALSEPARVRIRAAKEKPIGEPGRVDSGKAAADDAPKAS